MFKLIFIFICVGVALMATALVACGGNRMIVTRNGTGPSADPVVTYEGGPNHSPFHWNRDANSN